MPKRIKEKKGYLIGFEKENNCIQFLLVLMILGRRLSRTS